MTDTSQGRFEVVTWPSERRLVLYVPAIEAATSVATMTEADDAARSLIADLTGLPRDAKTRQRSVELLKSKGVDAVISFRAILQEFFAQQRALGKK